jgi:uncharacterized protein (TIGR01370 family)
MNLLFIIAVLIFSAFGGDGIEKVGKYAVCYAKITPADAKGFELLILDPDLYTEYEILEFKKNGIISIAYLNIAEFETYRGYSIPDSLILGKNPNWEDHFYVNIISQTWQDLIFSDFIPKIISKGFDGFFLDMIDIVQVFPHFKDKVIDMVRLIKEKNKDKIVIANISWSLIDTLKNFVDAFLVEGLFTRYSFEKKKYYVRLEKEYVDKIEVLKRTGKKIFTLDYLFEGDRRRNFVRNLSLHHGFTPYISTIELNKVYK